jgi:hypothetical protein
MLDGSDETISNSKEFCREFAIFGIEHLKELSPQQLKKHVT